MLLTNANHWLILILLSNVTTTHALKKKPGEVTNNQEPIQEPAPAGDNQAPERPSYAEYLHYLEHAILFEDSRISGRHIFLGLFCKTIAEPISVLFKNS